MLPELTPAEFERHTRYNLQSDTPEANRQRARLLGLEAEGVRVAPGAIIRLSAGGSIGPHCFIGLYCYLNGEVTLEASVFIGPHCSITSNTHCFDPASQAFTRNRRAPIVIGRGSWLCAGCSITAGTRVGRANLVCANAVVTRDTPDFAIMAGIPARVVGRTDPHTGASLWGEAP